MEVEARLYSLLTVVPDKSNNLCCKTFPKEQKKLNYSVAEAQKSCKRNSCWPSKTQTYIHLLRVKFVIQKQNTAQNCYIF